LRAQHYFAEQKMQVWQSSVLMNRAGDALYFSKALLRNTSNRWIASPLSFGYAKEPETRNDGCAVKKQN
jgi:hypothetical protein